ncbi:MAG: carboxypeptidase regulatory-like domain-containing protein [Candidatus Saganbacteria bacterium]|nr:carboxypeptidase regulatory-like domain-containing protein [Candidatus Saganbacteria bacterium]
MHVSRLCRDLLYKIIIPTFVIFNLSFVIFLSGCGDIDSEVVSLTVSPATATVGVSQSQSFSVVAKNSLGNIISVTPTWSVVGGIGSVTSTGLFTASVGSGEGTVVGTYTTITGVATVSVTSNCWIEGKVTGERDTGGIVNLLVSIRNTSYSAYTNSSGNYSISSLPAATYEVYTPQDNQIYLSSSEEVTVATGETKTQNFYLELRPGIPSTTTTTFPF